MGSGCLPSWSQDDEGNKDSKGGVELCEAVCIADEQDIADFILVQIMLLQTQIMQFKVIKRHLETDFVEPVDAGKLVHGGDGSIEGEDNRSCPSVSVQILRVATGQLRPAQEDVVFNNLWLQLYTWYST